MTVIRVPNPPTKEALAYRAAMSAKTAIIADWIAHHGPILDPITNEWIMSQVTPMLSDGIEITAQEAPNGWFVYSFRYPAFVQPGSEPEPEPAPDPEAEERSRIESVTPAQMGLFDSRLE